MSKYKLCVYAICKNEISNIQSWIDSVKEADVVVVLDTGSTDGTWEILQQNNIICHQKIINPFRFDTARNEALNLIPEDCDICLPLDIDMKVLKGFCNNIKNAWKDDISVLHIPQYFKTNNTSGSWFAHSRYGVHWKYPVYEMIVTDGKHSETINTIVIHDWDITKETHDMYQMLADLAIKENPIDPYCRRTKYMIDKEVNERKKLLS